MSVLIIERVNHRFQRMTNSRQASGLSVCLNLIKSADSRISVIQVENMEHIHLAISRFKPTKVILEALWASEEQLKVLVKRYPSKKFYVHIHSNIPFLACEGSSFMRIAEAYNQGVGIIFNNKRSADCFRGAIYLPNVYSIPFLAIKKESEKEHIDIVCAGSMRLMKNQVAQAMASIIYAESIGKKLRFHCNMGRSEGGAEVIAALKGLFFIHKSHELVDMPWMNHSEFINYLSEMDMGLQVSMSESFNIVAADYCTAGIPMVVSEEIEWADDNCKAPTGDPIAIAQLMSGAHHSIGYNRYNLRNYSNEARQMWSDFCDS